MIYAGVNQKGGVGKTTTMLNLAVAASERGLRVLVIDLDPQANTSTLLGVRAVDSVYDALIEGPLGLGNVIVTTDAGVDLAPGHRALTGLEGALRDEMGKEFLLREAICNPLEDFKGHYDVIFIDTPPTAGLLVNLALVAADVALVPLACEELAVEGLAQITETIRKAKSRFNPALAQRVVLTMADYGLTHTGGIEEAARAHFGAGVCQTVIPRQVEMQRPLSGGGAVVRFAPKSSGALAYCALERELNEESTRG